MEDFKIAHFVSENRGVPFPHYESLSAKENEAIRVRLSEAFGFSQSLAGISLATKIAQLQSHVEGLNAGDENFDLENVTQTAGISVHDKVFVNWYHFDKIDTLAFKDLAVFLGYIWYPSSDDIDIFDSSFSWIVSITHQGEVYIAQRDKKTKEPAKDRHNP